MNKQLEDVILSPITKVYFGINEAARPNKFHSFLLEAVRDKYSISDIASATLLKKDTIEKELLILVKQGLLDFKDDSYYISEVTSYLIELDQIIQKLNEKKNLYFDMVSQKIFEGNSDDVCLSDETTEQSLKLVGENKLYKYASYLLEDFRTDISNIFPELNEYKKEKMDFCFNSITINFNEEIIWRKIYSEKIKDIIGTGQDNKGNVSIYGKYYCYNLKYGEEEKQIFADSYTGEIYDEPQSGKRKVTKWTITLPVAFSPNILEEKIIKKTKKEKQKINIQFIDCKDYEVNCSLERIIGEKLV